jgi:SAM-dependent methyltransferase
LQNFENRFGMVAPMTRKRLGVRQLPSPVTDEIFARIADLDLGALSARITDTDRIHWERQEPNSAAWRRVGLHYAVFYDLDGASRLTGLTASAPPDDVHAMARGSGAAGGSLYHADMIFGALQAAGIALPRGARILDFGCSSGRVIRVVKAYRADLSCYGCDPQNSAIRWASEHLPNITFATSGARPPLAYDSSFFDCVFAISIWSHFAADAAIAWLGEMHRVLSEGGILILTTHSFESIAYYASRKLRSPADLRMVLESMLATGFGYLPVFDGRGDWGIVSPDWGEAYISPEWLLDQLTPQWEVLLYRSGANEGNQDVMVLRKRAPLASG